MCAEPQLDMTGTADATDQAPRRLARPMWGLVWIGLLAALFVHVLRSVDTSILYYGDLVGMPSGTFLLFPVFERGGAFFSSLAFHPGGLTEWAGAYLSQFFIMPYWGAAILTAVAAGLFVTINSIVSRVAGARSRSAGVVGVVLLVFIWNHYEFSLSDALALTLSLLAAAAVMAQRRALVRVVCLVVGTLGLYGVLGAPALLFAATCGLHECGVARRYVSAAAWWLVGAATPYLVGAVALSLPVGESYLRLSGLGRYGDFPVADVIPIVFRAWVALYLLPIAAILVAVVYRWLASRRADRPVSPRRAVFAPVALAVVIVLGGMTVHWTLDSYARWVLRLHAMAAQHAWAELLVEADARPEAALSPQLTRHINRALFETDQLGSRMFAYPQCPGGLLAQPVMSGVSAEASEVLLELGLVNQAEHGACRLLELWGPRPSTLKLLAMIFIAKDEPDTARVFLRRLERDVIWAGWARQMQDRLDEDPSLATDAQIARIRGLRPTSRAYAPSDVRAALVEALRARPTNRMAFEYLMATQLTAKQVGSAVALLQSYGLKQGYNAPPEHYAEAVAVFMLQTGQRPGLGPLMPRDATVRRVSQSFEIIQDRSRAPAVFARVMPDSYCRYLWVGDAGRLTHE